MGIWEAVFEAPREEKLRFCDAMMARAREVFRKDGMAGSGYYLAIRWDVLATVPDRPCLRLTAKKLPCRHVAVGGSDFCKRHGGRVERPSFTEPTPSARVVARDVLRSIVAESPDA